MGNNRQSNVLMLKMIKLKVSKVLYVQYVQNVEDAKPIRFDVVDFESTLLLRLFVLYINIIIR